MCHGDAIRPLLSKQGPCIRCDNITENVCTYLFLNTCQLWYASCMDESVCFPVFCNIKYAKSVFECVRVSVRVSLYQ